MKLKDETKEIGLQQTNSIFQLWIKLKDSIFNVLFVLLDNNDQQQSLLGLLFQVGVDYLQMMAFPFNSSVIAVWNGGSTLNQLTQLIKLLSINSFLPNVSFDTFLIMVYVLIFAIILVILDIIYVGYSFSKKKFKFTWPLVLLAKIVPLLLTVFFLPIMETLYSVVTCSTTPQSPNVQVMSSFPEIVCWQGWHLFHAIITLLFSTIFVFIACIVALAIFQPRITTNRLTARQNSTGQVVFIINKIICQFFFSFTPFQGTWIYCILLFSLSAWLYWTYNINDPYYNKKASKFFRIVSTYYFWTNFMLLVSQCLYEFEFQGGLIVWISGVIFIALTIIFQKKSNIDKLFSSNLKFRSGQQLQNHIKYVLLLIHNQKEDKNSYMLLLGYIQKHKDICTQEDCPLKISKNSLSNYNFNNQVNLQMFQSNNLQKSHHHKKCNLSKKQDQKQQIDVQMEQNCAQLVKQLQRMYKNGIKKYPTCTKLRLSFAFFYMQKLKNNAKAYQQFAIAQQKQPTFGQQFIIYRFRKIIRQKLEQKDKDDDSQLIDIIKLDNHISLCEQAMMLSAKLHRQFWSQLEEQTPDLKKLNSIGSKITSTISSVSLNFKQITKINNGIIQISYNYGLYLVLIQQEEQKGKSIISKAKQKYKQKMKNYDYKRKKQFIFDDSNIDTCLYPILVVSAKPLQLGKIILANSLFTQLTGFYKQQLLERNLQKLLPQIYTGYHNLMIKRWLSGASQNNIYINSIHQGFLKHKSGFTIRVTYKIRFQNNDKQQFLISFKPIKSQKYKSIIITDRVGNMKDISADIFYLLGLDKQMIEKQDQLIENYIRFPQVDEDQKRIPNLSFQAMLQIRGVQQFISVQRQQIRIKSLTQISITKTKTGISMINELETDIYNNGTQRIGYIYYITKPINLGGNANNNDMECYVNQSLFLQQMINQQVCNKFYQIDDANLFIRQESYHKTFEYIKHDYGQNIKIMRLFSNGDFKRVYYDEQDQSDYDFQETFEDEKDLLKVRKLKNPQYQEKIKDSINTNITLEEINNVKIGSIVFILIISIIIILTIILSTTQIKNIIEKTTLLVNQIQQFNFISKGVSNSLQNQQNINQTQQYLNFYNHTVSLLPDITIQYLSQDFSKSSKNMTDFMVYLNGKLMQCFNSQKISQDKLIIYTNYLALYNSIQTQVILKSQFDMFILRNCIFLIVIFFSSLFFSIFQIYQFLKIEQIRTNIMIWFLQIPICYVNFINNNCNKFLKNYVQVKQMEVKGIKSDDKDQFFQQYDDYLEEQQFEQQRKIRKTLIARHNKKTLFSKLDPSYFKFIWIIIYSCCFSVIFIVIGYDLFKVSQFLQPHIKLTGDQLRWNHGLQIGMNLEQTYTSLNSVNLTQFNENIKQHFLNYLTDRKMVYHSNQILDYTEFNISKVYQATFFNNLCQQISDQNRNKCENALNGTLKGGYQTYSKDIQNIVFGDRQQLKFVQYTFIYPILLKLIQSEKEYLISKVNSTLSFGSVILYLFLTISGLGFAIPWIIYLRKKNTSIVQTIKMLNMIPLFLIPRARKQTRQFIDWIIHQANKEKHSQ